MAEILFDEDRVSQQLEEAKKHSIKGSSRLVLYSQVIRYILVTHSLTTGWQCHPLISRHVTVSANNSSPPISSANKAWLYSLPTISHAQGTSTK